MSIDERSRHEMYQRLEAVLGVEAASTLMEHLPPVGWADVATKRDLELLEHKLMSALYRELNAQTRTLMLGMLGMVFTAVSLTYVAVRLA